MHDIDQGIFIFSRLRWWFRDITLMLEFSLHNVVIIVLRKKWKISIFMDSWVIKYFVIRCHEYSYRVFCSLLQLMDFKSQCVYHSFQELFNCYSKNTTLTYSTGKTEKPQLQKCEHQFAHHSTWNYTLWL